MAKRATRKITNKKTLAKMRTSHLGSRNGMWHKRQSDTTKRKISRALKRYWATIK